MAHSNLHGILRIFLACVALTALASVAEAQCKCPTPRPMHATATSGVITMAHKEEFDIEVNEPPSIEIVIAHDYSNMVDALQEVARRIEGAARERIRASGFQGEIKIRWVYSETATFSGTGFEFLNNQSGNVENREVHVNIYGRSNSGAASRRGGIFEVEVKLRAQVCVENNETHLTFAPETRKRMRYVPLESVIVPPEMLNQKKREFESRVVQEIGRLEGELAGLQHSLTEDRQRQIREAAVEHFDEKLPVHFFNQPYVFPVRVVPLQQVRICSSTIGN